jgi:hypothetical protein
VLKRFHYKTLVITSLLLLAACGGEAPPESVKATPDTTKSADKAAVAGTADRQEPVNDIPVTIDYISRDALNSLKGKECELLTAEDIKAVARPENAEISSFSILGCQYSWDKPNAQEIAARNQEIAAKGMADGLSFVDIGKRQTPAENTISLYLDTYSAPQSTDMLDAQYRSLTNMLSDEEKARTTAALKEAFEKVSTGDTGAEPLSAQEKAIASSLMGVIAEETRNDSYVAVEGVGLRAAWSDYANKLVVQHRNMFFTLSVNTGEDAADLEAASNLAAKIVERLNSAL